MNSEGNLDDNEKSKMKQFLTECKNNLMTILNTEKTSYKLINSDFTPTLEQSETYQNNSHFIIKKKEDANLYHTNKINPLATQTKIQLA